MVELVYDGTFEGLLTCIFEIYDRKYKVSNIQAEAYLQHSFTEQIIIKTDTQKAQRVYKGAREKIGNTAMQKVYRVFLSNDERKSLLIYKMMKKGFKLGGSVINKLQDDDIRNFIDIDKKVSFEAHRMYGLVRFKKVTDSRYKYSNNSLPASNQQREGLYYCAYEPDHNITFLIAEHFKKRMADQFFIIHDKRRNVAAVYDKNELVFTSIEKAPDFKEDEEELFYEHLWKDYFKNIAVKERENQKCQLNYMPRRYWKHLTEIIV